MNERNEGNPKGAQASWGVAVMQSDVWSAGRVVQYLLITIAIGAIGYTGKQMTNLVTTISHMDSRLIRLEANVSGLMSSQIKDIHDDLKDHESRLRRLENAQNK